MLQTASFPDGAGPSDILPDIVEYGLAQPTEKTLVALTPVGALTAIPDPVAEPGTQIALDSNVQEILSFSDKGHVAYAKHFVGTSLVDLFVSKADGTGTCAIDTTTSVPFVSVVFSPNAEAAVWARSRSGGFDGLHTRLSDCSTMSLAEDVAALAWIGHEVVLFVDDFELATGTGSIRYRSVAADQVLEPGTPTLVANHVDSYAISGPEPGALLYSVNGGAEPDGVYIRWFGP
jgi:hypothetical protein